MMWGLRRFWLLPSSASDLYDGALYLVLEKA
jgi:hypothetical protein